MTVHKDLLGNNVVEKIKEAVKTAFNKRPKLKFRKYRGNRNKIRNRFDDEDDDYDDDYDWYNNSGEYVSYYEDPSLAASEGEKRTMSERRHHKLRVQQTAAAAQFIPHLNNSGMRLNRLATMMPYGSSETQLRAPVADPWNRRRRRRKEGSSQGYKFVKK